MNTVNVVILPSKEGLEIPILLKMGVKQSNIHTVDTNSAILSDSSWNRLYPEVKRYPCDIGDAFKIMAVQNIKIGMANVDICGPISRGYIEVLEKIRDSGVLTKKARLAFTMLKGRELSYYINQGHAAEWKQANGDRHEFANLILGKRYSVRTLHKNWYTGKSDKFTKNGVRRHSSPMAWHVVEVRNGQIRTNNAVASSD